MSAVRIAIQFRARFFVLAAEWFLAFAASQSNRLQKPGVQMRLFVPPWFEDRVARNPANQFSLNIWANRYLALLPAILCGFSDRYDVDSAVAAQLIRQLSPDAVSSKI